MFKSINWNQTICKRKAINRNPEISQKLFTYKVGH